MSDLNNKQILIGWAVVLPLTKVLNLRALNNKVQKKVHKLEHA